MTDSAVTANASRARREFAAAILGCAAGAGLVLLAALRTWAVEVTPRPAPLPPVTDAVTGGTLVPWLSPLGVVALAGAAALLAARRGRPAIGALLAAVGVFLTVASGYGWAIAGDGDRASSGLAWPAASVVGGLVVAAVGLVTVRRGRDWPSLGARYERAGASAAPAPAEPSAAPRAGDPATLWDALDRGEDPTARR